MNNPARIVSLLSLVLAVVLAARLGCAELGHSETGMIVQKSRNDVLRVSGSLSAIEQQKLQEGFDRAIALADEDRLSPIARDTLRRRSEVVLADGRLSPAEAAHLIELLTDIPVWKDEVHAVKYMGQR